MNVSGKTRHRVVCCFLGRNNCNLVIQDVDSLELLERVVPFTQLLSSMSPANRAVPYSQCVHVGEEGRCLEVSWMKEILNCE